MQKLARQRAEQISIPVEMIALELGQIQAENARFDSIVCTFTLCTIPDAVAALREMRRVLKPGGKLLFSEHGLAPDASVVRWQNRLTPLWKPLAGGCHLNRDIPALLEAGGFTIGQLETSYLKGPRPMTWSTAAGPTEYQRPPLTPSVTPSSAATANGSSRVSSSALNGRSTCG